MSTIIKVSRGMVVVVVIVLRGGAAAVVVIVVVVVVMVMMLREEEEEEGISGYLFSLSLYYTIRFVSHLSDPRPAF